MRSTRALTRLGLLAVGLGVGGAIAFVPGSAAADSSSDWLSSIDSLLGGAVPAASDAAAGPDVAISYDGAILFQEGSASASSGTDGDFAIAYGADSSAIATGTDSYATVYGEDSHAVAGGVGSSTDTAGVLGDGSYAEAGGLDSSNDVAFVYGDSSSATAGGYGDNPGNLDISGIVGSGDGANAGSSAAGAGDYDIAYVESNDLGTANATGLSDLVDILKQYDNWAATGGLPTVDAAASTSPLTDLLSAFDGGSAAADTSNLWTELASLF